MTNLLKKPWYEPTGRKAPRGNDALEAFIFKVHEQVFDPTKRRKINNNLTAGERQALHELIDLVSNHGIVIRFEDKGSRFVIDTIENHDETILADLNDESQYDKLPSNPIEHVKNRVEDFAGKWRNELDEFHPNVRNWITKLEESEPGKAKGLIKCHKTSLPNGKKPYRLLLCGTNTPVKPLYKLVQDALAEDWTSYLATVELDSRQGEISELMINNGHVRKHYSNLVPSTVPHKLFWARYFFKVGPITDMEIFSLIDKSH